MNNNPNYCLSGVVCNVAHCQYHTPNNCCTANSIDVSNEKAAKKTETFCSTFKPNNSTIG